MKIIISPALTFKETGDFETTNLIFKEKSEALVERLASLSLSELSNIIRASEEINIRTYYQYQEFDFERLLSPAIFAFDGLVFKEFSPKDFKDPAYLQDHLYILSGLFGALKAFTGICPYRLEMKSPGLGLYKFRGDDLYQEVFKAKEPVINLASREYSKAITSYLVPGDVLINISFKDIYKGRLKTIVAWEKAMRGKMTKKIIQEKIKNPLDIRELEIDNYIFDETLSDDRNFVFVRRQR